MRETKHLPEFSTVFLKEHFSYRIVCTTAGFRSNCRLISRVPRRGNYDLWSLLLDRGRTPCRVKIASGEPGLALRGLTIEKNTGTACITGIVAELSATTKRREAEVKVTGKLDWTRPLW